MRGYIRRRSKGTYELWIELPRTNGRRGRESYTVRGTKKEAEAQLSVRIAAIENGDTSRSSRMTVQELLERWLESRRPNVGGKTFERYQGICACNLVPILGAVPLRKLTPLHIEEALAKWRSCIPQKRKTGSLRARTVHHIFSTLKAALAQGVRWNLLARNAADAVTPPTKGRAEVKALDVRGALALLEVLGGGALAVPVQLALLTGLRRGELLALRWTDIDLEAGTLHVRRSLEQLRGGAVAFKEPKTRQSRRDVPLPAESVELLRTHRAQQNTVRLVAGGTYNSEEMVFPKPATGSPWPPDNFSAAFYHQARKAKVPVTFHGLRHSYASISLRAEVPMKVVSQMLGHTTTAITADLYTHVVDEMQREAADRVGAAFAQERSLVAARRP